MNINLFTFKHEKYELVKELGSGGAVIVWEARRKDIGTLTTEVMELIVLETNRMIQSKGTKRNRQGVEVARKLQSCG